MGIRHDGVGSIALILCVLAAPADAGSITFSHSIQLGPRAEAANIALYERDVTMRALNPDRFDRAHPLIGRILTEPTYYQEMLSRWESHPWNFEHHHPHLWRVLDGDMLWHERHGGLGVG